DARVVYLGWAGVFDRVFTPPYDNVGKTWDEGGFDAQLVGWTPGLLPEPRQGYYGAENFFAPDGQNYPLWSDEEANNAMDTFITTTDSAVQEEMLKVFQRRFFEEMPASQIFYDSRPAVINPAITNWYNPQPNGEGWVYFNVQPTPELLKGKSTVVYASTGEIESLIPPLANSWYDTIIIAQIFNGLAQTWPSLRETDYAVPNLLISWAPSEDGFKWTFNCRQTVKWHDGEDFTADDVVFSLWALMNPNTGSQFSGYYKSVYGDNVVFTYTDGTTETLGDGDLAGTITAVDQYTVEATLPVLADGKPYGYFDPYLLAFATNIIPKHIFGEMDPGTWTDSPFNSGQGEITVGGKTYTGPIGTGPYKWVSFNPVAQIVTMEKNMDYWNRTALESEGMFGVEKYYIKFIADKTAALASLKNGEVDILDPNYMMAVDIPTIDPAWGRVLNHEGAGRQEIGYNNQHPIFGTGVDTPLGKEDPSRAAEAARYVRTAFDYAIPRELIINNLLAGFGTPGATPILPTNFGYDPMIAPREYSLETAREYLALAGYTVPGQLGPIKVTDLALGMPTAVSGIFTDAEDNVMANRELALYSVKVQEDYNVSAVLVDRTVTGLDGFYNLMATETETGDHHYYVFDRLAAIGEEWNYVGKVTVSAAQDLTTVTYIAYAAIAIAVILGLVAIYFATRKR
ncbi:hypothetical protein KAI12_04480, partial [Candidatus Bathyarchaeota archaeon]|nr:hypothetical protein [Candidatus Bathyarchaeota archaeon]